jgi:hypothetical protein
MHDQSTNGLLAKDSKIKEHSKLQFMPSVMDFTLHDAVSSMFNEDNGSGWGKAYDNFTNDFLCQIRIVF